MDACTPAVTTPMLPPAVIPTHTSRLFSLILAELASLLPRSSSIFSTCLCTSSSSLDSLSRRADLGPARGGAPRGALEAFLIPPGNRFLVGFGDLLRFFECHDRQKISCC